MKTLHHVSFPPNPVYVIRRGTRHGVKKQRLSEKLNVDGRGFSTGFDGLFQARTQLPDRIERKRIKLELFFLKRQPRQIIAECSIHAVNIVKTRIVETLDTRWFSNKPSVQVNSPALYTHPLPGTLIGIQAFGVGDEVGVKGETGQRGTVADDD